ncbi:MATE family efflux transporter [Oricola sp.]|uniref:MATE family efflux transporter n=1 Tax=Oricola sp. TaxID=1979950 RepID=UPI0025CFD47E|nr:MATE family efflux transporter [Oricola sp.]MCI5078532.1 MATE family efflux transporter [Oricola sp.]
MAPPAGDKAKFTSGSTMRHVVVMTMTGSIGLVAIFAVDALNLFYISLLGQAELAAAIGYAGTLMFFTISAAIGLTIATGAMVSRALGAGNRAEAARRGGAAMLFMAVVTTVISVSAWLLIPQLLGLIGAQGETKALADSFLRIVFPSIPVMALGMCTTGILRGVGDARRAMYVTLAGGAAAAVLDPLLIFGLDLGLQGAAISTVLSRIVLLAVGLHGAVVVHKLIARPDIAVLREAMRPFFNIGGPAVMTQLATPVGNAYVTAQIASFGDGAVAGWAIIGRLIPVAFGVIFSLSGAVGPILGQNYGAKLYHRLFETMRDALIFTTIYVLVIWGLLALSSGLVADVFRAEGEARELVVFFCLFAAASFLFNGALFVANAAFNNLGFALYSTVLNWGRSTLGVIPFVWLGAQWYGAIGVIAGWALGAVVFGVAAVFACFRVIASIEQRDRRDHDDNLPSPPPTAQSPFSTGKAATLG